MQGQVLSSWKEIASYMGKGVRTVQRWEAELGLPVRRPGHDHHVVVAFPSELDAWARGNYQPQNGDGRPEKREKVMPDPEGNHHHMLDQLRRMRALMVAMTDALAKNKERTSRLLARLEEMNASIESQRQYERSA